MLVSLDQICKHAFLLSIIYVEYVQLIALERSISTAPTNLFLSDDCFQFSINLSKSDDKRIWKLRESYLQMELGNYEYTFHTFLKTHLVLKQVYSSPLLGAYISSYIWILPRLFLPHLKKNCLSSFII